MTTKVILDTDIGTDVDDALALAFLMARPDVDLVGVTTVHGNTPLRSSVARALLALGGRDSVPVVMGRSAPLRRSTVPDFHWNELWGHEGVGLLWPASGVPDDDPLRDDAATFIINQAREHPHEIALVATGPLTNVARALQLDPTLPSILGPVTIMGGLVDKSLVPWPAHFETNLNADPGAAEIVLGSTLQMLLVPLEVTLQVFLTASDRTRLATSGLPVPEALERLIGAMREPFLAFNARYGLDGSDFDTRTYLHDPLAAYAALGGANIELRRTHIKVEYEENTTLRTVEHADLETNMSVCFAADGPAFVREWMTAVLSSIPRLPN